MMSTRHFVLCVLCSVTIAACGSAVNKDLDDARIALDRADYSAAIVSAGSAAASAPTELNAFNLLSSAYSGQAGVNLLTLAQTLTNSGNNATMFSALHTDLVTQLVHTGTDYTAGFASLDSAITTLTGYTGTVASSDSVLQKQYYFQEGILMYIEALGLPTITAQPTAAGAITQGNVTAAITTTVQNDFINGYAALTNAATGIPTTNELATTLSTNYCVLKNSSVATGTASGISLGVLQDLTVCQLNTAYAGPFAAVANCAALNFAVCDGTVAPAL